MWLLLLPNNGPFVPSRPAQITTDRRLRGVRGRSLIVFCRKQSLWVQQIASSAFRCRINCRSKRLRRRRRWWLVTARARIGCRRSDQFMPRIRLTSPSIAKSRSLTSGFPNSSRYRSATSFATTHTRQRRRHTHTAYTRNDSLTCTRVKLLCSLFSRIFFCLAMRKCSTVTLANSLIGTLTTNRTVGARIKT